MKRSSLLLATCLLYAIVDSRLSCHLVKPRPSGSICGVSGYLNIPKDDPSIKGPYSTTLSQCREISRDIIEDTIETTADFLYDFDSSNCTLKIGYHDRDKFVEDLSSSQKFWTYPCYECDLHCKGLGGAADNIILNGGFEYSNTDFRPFTDSLGHYEADIVSPGVNSNNMYRCQANATADLIGACVFQQRVYSCSDQVYVLVFDYLVTAPHIPLTPNPHKQASYLEVSMGDLTFYDPVTLSNNGTWQKFTGSFVINDENFLDGRLYLYFQSVYKNTTLYVDNLQAFPVKTVPKDGSRSLLVNGGFETGKIAPWKVQRDVNSKYLRIVKPGFNSTYALEVHVPKNSSLSLSQQIKTVPGKIYILSYNSKVYKDDPSYYIEGRVTVNDTHSKYDWHLDSNDGYRTGDDWYHFDRVFTAREDKMNVTLLFQNGYFRLDDISVKEARD